MECIYCKKQGTAVVNSRANSPGVIWRRRQCLHCGMKFTTEESSLGNNLYIIKRNGKRQRFVYEKLLTALVYAFEKGKGADHGDQALLAKHTAQKIIAHINAKGRKEVTTALVIALCYESLSTIYPQAAERFMHYSLYREQICAPLRAADKARNR